MDDGSRQLSKAARSYRLLLFLYPAQFRQDYGEGMMQLFRDQWLEVQRHESRSKRVDFWLRLFNDTWISAVREHLSCIKGKGFMKRNLGSLMPGLAITFLAMIVGLALAGHGLTTLRDVLSPRSIIFLGQMSGVDFGLCWGLGIGLLVGLPFVIPRILPDSQSRLAIKSSFWLIASMGCFCLTVVGCYFLFGSMPPDTAITSRTLSFLFLVPSGLLVLLAVFSALLSITGGQQYTFDADSRSITSWSPVSRKPDDAG
jgi:hypothetical protein